MLVTSTHWNLVMAPQVYGLTGEAENSDILSHMTEQMICIPSTSRHTKAPPWGGSKTMQPVGGRKGGGGSVVLATGPGHWHGLSAKLLQNTGLWGVLLKDNYPLKWDIFRQNSTCCLDKTGIVMIPDRGNQILLSQHHIIVYAAT